MRFLMRMGKHHHAMPRPPFLSHTNIPRPRSHPAAHPPRSYVACSVAATALMTQFLAVKVALARREYGVPYPQVYATGDSQDAVTFNCIQRAHLNCLEYLPNALACQMVMGLQFPVAAAALGAGWTVGRLVYAAGYSSGDPAKRGPGSALAGVIYLGLIGGAAASGAVTAGLLTL